jgi:hypothetical protein
MAAIGAATAFHAKVARIQRFGHEHEVDNSER